MNTYKIVRCYQNPKRDKEVLDTGLTLEEAQAHCRDPETSSRTATKPENIERTERCGAWFDSYDEE